VFFDAAPDVAARLPGAIASFDTKLATTSSGRNWRTVTRLLGLRRA
jgi:hypothetical protein